LRLRGQTYSLWSALFGLCDDKTDSWRRPTRARYARYLATRELSSNFGVLVFCMRCVYVKVEGEKLVARLAQPFTLAVGTEVGTVP